jgi:hypothetical protein
MITLVDELLEVQNVVINHLKNMIEENNSPVKTIFILKSTTFSIIMLELNILTWEIFSLFAVIVSFDKCHQSV